MENDFKPRSIDWVARKLGVPAIESIETCRTVFPTVEIGTYQRPADLTTPLFVFATITRPEGVEYRASYLYRLGLDHQEEIRRVHVTATGKREWL